MVAGFSGCHRNDPQPLLTREHGDARYLLSRVVSIRTPLFQVDHVGRLSVFLNLWKGRFRRAPFREAGEGPQESLTLVEGDIFESALLHLLHFVNGWLFLFVCSDHNQVHLV